MVFDPNNELELLTDRLILKLSDPSMAYQVLDFYNRNREHFQNSMPEVSESFYTTDFQLDRLWREYDTMLEKKSIRFFFFKNDDLAFQKIIGDISIFNILQGLVQSCTIGYKIDYNESGKGYMFEAVEKVVEFIFNDIKLHRIEAMVLPTNERSLAIVERLGFTCEGACYKYCKIDGKWLDHLRYSLINPNNC